MVLLLAQTHLERLAGIQVLALVDPLQEVGEHDGLLVGPGQLQQVGQALVPGLEGAQLARVLAQPHGHRVQQPGCTVPAHADTDWLISNAGMGPCLAAWHGYTMCST